MDTSGRRLGFRKVSGRAGRFRHLGIRVQVASNDTTEAFQSVAALI